MDYENALIGAGLTKTESKVYLAILKLGPTRIGDILRESGAHSSVAYNSLQHLYGKGLVTYVVKDGRKLFTAESPDTLLNLIKEKEEKLETALPYLKSLGRKKYGDNPLFISEGDKALKSAFNDMLAALGKGSEQLVMGVSNTGSGFGTFLRHWDEKRVKRGISKRVIVSNDSREWSDYYSVNNVLTKVRKAKWLLNPGLTINIYGDRTLLIMWSTQPIIIRIERRDITKGFRSYFEMLWQMSAR